jgi:hypothetical protein
MNSELRHYLELLLEHECKPKRERCPECRSLQRISEFMASEIFSTILYPETATDGKDEGERVKRATAHPQRPHS